MGGQDPSSICSALEDQAARCLAEFRQLRVVMVLTEAVALNFARQAAADSLNYSLFKK